MRAAFNVGMLLHVEVLYVYDVYIIPPQVLFQTCLRLKHRLDSDLVLLLLFLAQNLALRFESTADSREWLPVAKALTLKFLLTA